MNLFISGSAFIMAAQLWKLYKNFSQEGKSFKQIYKEDPSGVNVDFFAGIGGLMYFIGTFVFKKTTEDPFLTNFAALIYSFGGLFFFTSALFIQKRYFWQKGSQAMYGDEPQSVVSTEI